MRTDATHFHVDIRCHINSIGPTTFFVTQNESHHFEWHDFIMSRAIPFSVTHFGSKSAKSIFLIIYYFSITKNK
jgi:hypothetical protein